MSRLLGQAGTDHRQAPRGVEAEAPIELDRPPLRTTRRCPKRPSPDCPFATMQAPGRGHQPLLQSLQPGSVVPASADCRNLGRCSSLAAAMRLVVLVRSSHEFRDDAGCRSPRRSSGALLALAAMGCPGTARPRSCIRVEGGAQLCDGDRGDASAPAGPGRDWIPSRDPGVAPLSAWRSYRPDLPMRSALRLARWRI